MNSKRTIYIGAPLEGSEASFLRRLDRDLGDQSALIFANFVEKRQIDFVVVTDACAALIELKNFDRPLFGGMNGNWETLDLTGARVPLERENPYHQTLQQAYKLSEAMGRYWRESRAVPGAMNGAFYRNFSSFLCIFPVINPESKVSPGDHRVKIRSYGDVLQFLVANQPSGDWKLADWERFASQGLQLSRVSLSAAVDARVNEAEKTLAGYGARFHAMIADDLPPLAETGGSSGFALVDRLIASDNFCVIAPSGLGKTMHLKHAALSVLAGGSELPVWLDAKDYHGGPFAPYLQESLRPFGISNPPQILGVAKLAGIRPLLFVDGLNECGEGDRSDLLKHLASFALGQEARLVLSAQSKEMPLHGISPVVIELDELEAGVKRQIFAFHAGEKADPKLDAFCVGFNNGYDLALAGRCYAHGAPPATRTENFDRCMSFMLPQHHVAVSFAFLRSVAGFMNDNVTFSLRRRDFEAMAERFFAENGVPLSVLDEILKTRVVRVKPDSVSFEHELLLRYFKAEDLKQRVQHPTELGLLLSRPQNADLCGEVLGRLDKEEIIEVLAAIDNIVAFKSVVSGENGKAPVEALRSRVLQLLSDAANDIAEVTLELNILETDQARNVSLSTRGGKELNARQRAALRIAPALFSYADVREAFLDLADATCDRLSMCIADLANKHDVARSTLWDRIVHLNGGFVEKSENWAFLLVYRELEEEARYGSTDILRAEWLARSTVDYLNPFALCRLLEDRHGLSTRGLVLENLAIVRRAWDTRIGSVRIAAIQSLQSMRLAAEEAQQLEAVREFLSSCRSKNWMLQSVITETLSIFGGMQPPVSVRDALDEMRACIGFNVDENEELIQALEKMGESAESFVAKKAYGCIANFFEDIFQGAYDEAFDRLDESERCKLLMIAARIPRDGSHMHLAWIIRQILKGGYEGASEIFLEIAAGGVRESGFIQDNVAAYALALKGLALNDVTFAAVAQRSAEERAWTVVGRWLMIAFANADGRKSAEVFSEDLTSIDSVTLRAMAVAIHWLDSASYQIVDDFREANHYLLRMLAACGREQILAVALAFVRDIDDVESRARDWRFGSTIKTVFAILAEYGTQDAVADLRRFANDRELGGAAIATIEQIQRRR